MCFFQKVCPLKIQPNLWPYLLAPNSLIVKRKRKYWYMLINSSICFIIHFMFWVLIISERMVKISWSTTQSLIELPQPLLFSYMTQTHNPFKLIICVYKTHTSMFIYIDFKESRSGPHKQAYWYPTKVSYGVSMGWGNESLFKLSWSHDQSRRHDHIYMVKP